MIRFLSGERSLLVGIVALAAFFRFYRLDQLPPGFQFDQAFYVFDAIRLLQGEFHIFFAAPGGTEPLYVYLAMVGVSIFGDNAFGLKLTSAVIGVLTIPLIYGFARTVFQSARIGLLAAFFTAISIWHIFYGRYGERITLSILLAVLLFWFFWRALSPSPALRGRAGVGVGVWRDFVLTGLFLTLGVYTNLAGRVLPLALLLITAYMMWSDRPNAQFYFKGLIIVALTAMIIFLPLGIYFVYHPDQFISHAAQVSIFVPHANEQGDVPTALVRNTLRLLGMFFVQGDDGMIRNVPGRPVFDPLLGILFIAGAFAWLAALVSPRATAVDRKRAVFLAAWLFSVMLLSLITDDAPNFDRLQPGIPPVMIIPAWGAAAIWDRLRAPVARRAAGLAFGVIAVLSTGLGYRDYFVVLGNDPGLYYAYNVDKVEISDWLNRNAQKSHIFLAPVAQQVGTISLLTRNAPLKSFESRDTIVLPSRAAGKDALFVFPSEQERKAQTMAARLGALGAVEQLTGSNGGSLIFVYRVPARNLPDPQDPLAALATGGAFVQPQTIRRANWVDRIELLGGTISPEGPGGRNVTVGLFLRALQSLSEDYTFSVKVRDQQDRVWGQEDKWPGNNSYATTQWSAGDLMVEKFYPGLSACAPAGKYTVSVETYNPKTMEVLPLSQGDAFLGSFAAGASEGNRPEDLEPEQRLETKVADLLRLTGFTLSPDSARAGEKVTLSLFWRGVGAGSTEQVVVRLGDSRLVEDVVKLPGEGRGLCSFYDLTVPANLSAGKTALWVNDSKIAEVQVTK
ncbi:MAG: glycosyltransferase family 39 protein [Chloroflexi bacterium]|nr:glycosyltransferase family 39 protein [Chloroflexota bacterium]